MTQKEQVGYKHLMSRFSHQESIWNLLDSNAGGQNNKQLVGKDSTSSSYQLCSRCAYKFKMNKYNV